MSPRICKDLALIQTLTQEPKKENEKEICLKCVNSLFSNTCDQIRKQRKDQAKVLGGGGMKGKVELGEEYLAYFCYVFNKLLAIIKFEKGKLAASGV